MKRTEILLLQREKVLVNLSENKDNRAKWLAALIDIDDEMEEMRLDILVAKQERVFTRTFNNKEELGCQKAKSLNFK